MHVLRLTKRLRFYIGDPSLRRISHFGFRPGRPPASEWHSSNSIIVDSRVAAAGMVSELPSRSACCLRRTACAESVQRRTPRIKMTFMSRNVYRLVMPIALSAFTITAAHARQAPSQSQTGAATASPSTQSSPAPSPAMQPSPSSSPAGQTTPQQPLPNSSSQSNTQQASGAATSGTVIPAGTLITITPTQPIQNPQVGSTYSAQISQNVTGTNGSVLIPAGTQAQLTVTNALSPSGAQEQALALRSITLNGQTYNISSNQGQSSGQGSSTGSSQQGTASSGGLLGTLVQVLGGNGNQQASNGSQQGSNGNQQGNSGSQQGSSTQSSGGSGGLSGVLGQILTHGSQVNVPSQSQLTFRLEQPLQLQ